MESFYMSAETVEQIKVTVFSIIGTSALAVIGMTIKSAWNRRVTRKTIRIYLINEIRPTVFHLLGIEPKDEIGQIDQMNKFVDLSNGYKYLETYQFPLFNSNFTKGYTMNELRLAFRGKEKYLALLNVIGYLDGFKGRMPTDIQDQWGNFIEEHKKVCEVDIYSCEGVKHQTVLFQKNLEQTKGMAERLLIAIDKIVE